VICCFFGQTQEIPDISGALLRLYLLEVRAKRMPVSYRSKAMAQRVIVRRREPLAAPAPGGRQGSIVAGALWMFLISLLLFWLPVLGPLIAGLVGGKRAGGVGAAITAVFLPAVFVGILLFVLFTAIGLPLVGVLTGGIAFLTVAATLIGPLLIGAILGGLLA
jgi:hypothetical protein